MVGVFGGDVAASTADKMARLAVGQPWYEDRTIVEEPYQIRARTHGTDTGCGIRVRSGDGYAGVIYGLAYGPAFEEYGNEASLLKAVLDDPEPVLGRLDGSFAIAVADIESERVVLATDKLATHQIYYTDVDEFGFGTEFKTLMAAIDEPSIDVRGIGDMLQVRDCFIWGEKTFIEEIRALPPATYLRYDGQSLRTGEYWDVPDVSLSQDTYVADLLKAYESAVEESAERVSGTIGANLSGGVDSRLLVACLADEPQDLHTVTYDIHDRADTGPARDVAETLRVRNEYTPHDVEGFSDIMERGVELTDAMVPWLDYTNLRFVEEKYRSRFDAMFQSHGQGPLFGDHFFYERHFQADDPAQALYYFYYRDADYPQRLLVDDVDPHESIEAEIKQCNSNSVESILLSVNRKSYYTGYHYRREQFQYHNIPTIDVLSNGDILTLAENMPPKFRSHIRTTPPGMPPITDPVPRLKLDLITQRGGGIDDIIYQRTQHPPSSPFWRQKLRYWLGFGWELPGFRLPSGRATTYADLLRTDESFRTRITDLLEGIGGRSFVDESALNEIVTEHFKGGGGHLRPIAILTTLELWLRKYYD